MISDLIQKLENASQPTRELDGEIAQAVRWRRRVQRSELPLFTSSVDAALLLLNEIIPNSPGGISWSPVETTGIGTARASGGRYYHGSTPALALCAAILGAMESNSKAQH